jgi:hypothetical protein
MLVTVLTPVIGYDKAAQIAHHAMSHDITVRDAALELGGGFRADCRSQEDGGTPRRRMIAAFRRLTLFMLTGICSTRPAALTMAS